MKLWLGLLLIGGLLATVAQVSADDDSDDGIVTSEEEEQPQAVEEVADEYFSPTAAPGTYHFKEDFDNLSTFGRNWIKSTTKKDDTVEEIAQYDGVWAVEEPQRRLFAGDLGLVLKSKVKHAAISSKLVKPFVFNDKPLVVQYEVQLQEGQECGGSYLKLLTQGIDELTKFNDKTPYTIMFGPDKCGNDIKLHFIFRHVNPITGAIEEKHCRKAKERLEEPFKDKQPHLYTLIVRPDSSFTIKVDHRVVNEGSLLTDFTPPVNPEKEIDDPEDFKPSDWDEREKIANPDSVKPEDWDENAPPQIPDAGASKPDGWLDDEEELIYDPAAVKPEDWDTDMDGEWEAPLIANPICEKAVGCGLWKAPIIPNPNFKGKWHAPLIDNPNYRGKWTPARIPNPNFFEDLQPFRMKPITAIGFELWSISPNILFDNIIITDDEQVAINYAAQSFDVKQEKINVDAESFVTRVINFTNENPYMYAVYVVFLGLPLAFVVYFLCKESTPKTYEDEAAARRKKTDLEDVNEDVVEDAEEEPEEEVEQPKKYGLRNRKKADSQAKGNKEDLEAVSWEDDARPSASDESDDSGSLPQLIDATEEDDVAEDVPVPAAKKESVSENTRKRRPRKD